MASLGPGLSEKEVAKELKDAGNKLLEPPSLTQDLLNLLDALEHLLFRVGQAPEEYMLDALQPSVKALNGNEILMHNDTDVKVSVASCICQISRIMAPDAPFSDEKMKIFFQLCVVAVEKLSSTHGRSYLKAVSVLKTLANVRLCVLMLDLELNDLIVKMFEQFRDIKSQPNSVLSDVETIMTLVVEESEELSFELLSVLLNTVKKENQNVSPLSWELGQKVLKNCADKLVSDIPNAVSAMGNAYNDYADIVAAICKVTPTMNNLDTEMVADDIAVRKVDELNNEQPRSGTNDGQQRSVALKSSSQPSDITKEAAKQPQKKRGRKPNSLIKDEEGYDNSWIIGITSSRSREKNPKKRTANASNSSALEGITSSLPSGKEPKSHVFSIKNAHNIGLPSTPSHKCSSPEDVHSRHQSGVHQQKVINSLSNQDNGLNILSVSKGDLQRTVNEETPLTVPPKVSASTGDPWDKRKRVTEDIASQRDEKAKQKSVTRKNERQKTRDSTEKHRGMNLSKTGDIHQERYGEFPASQFDVMVQNGGRSTPNCHANEHPGDVFGGPTEVKKRRKCTSLGNKVDHGEELVGCKIKVWWPADEQFYRGVVTEFDRVKKKHKVLYIDGDEEILYLKVERWELVEDEDDSEATEDTKPTVISSANWCSSAQTNASGPVKGNQKAYGGKRTKRRTLHDKSMEQAIPPEHGCSDQVDKECSMLVDVRGYQIKPASVPILSAIFAKYGDIAAHCLFTSAAVRASLLEVICDIVKRLNNNTTDVIMLNLQSMETEVRDAEAAKIEVSWLLEYLKKIQVGVGESSSLLKEMKENTILVVKAAKRDLAQKQLEFAAAQEKVREAESCVQALTLVAKKFSNDILVRTAEESAWPKPLDNSTMP